MCSGRAERMGHGCTARSCGAHAHAQPKLLRGTTSWPAAALCAITPSLDGLAARGNSGSSLGGRTSTARASTSARAMSSRMPSLSAGSRETATNLGYAARTASSAGAASSAKSMCCGSPTPWCTRVLCVQK
eukprot:6989692-Prymnesium_polylepis.1